MLSFLMKPNGQGYVAAGKNKPLPIAFPLRLNYCYSASYPDALPADI